ncbi:MAG: hypothetical protein V9E94_19445, partial [Microthrixaceae bacterium]
MIDAKTLGIGGGVIAAAALVIGLMYMPAGQGAEIQAFKELHPLYVEFQKIRESKGSPSDLEALRTKISKVCPPIAKTMEPRASVEPARQSEAVLGGQVSHERNDHEGGRDAIFGGSRVRANVVPP